MVKLTYHVAVFSGEDTDPLMVYARDSYNTVTLGDLLAECMPGLCILMPVQNAPLRLEVAVGRNEG